DMVSAGVDQTKNAARAEDPPHFLKGLGGNGPGKLVEKEASADGIEALGFKRERFGQALEEVGPRRSSFSDLQQVRREIDASYTVVALLQEAFRETTGPATQVQELKWARISRGLDSSLSHLLSERAHLSQHRDL